MGQSWGKNDLLSDLDTSIDNALREGMIDLSCALIRLKASTLKWCDRQDCGDCLLAPMRCITDPDEATAGLIKDRQDRDAFPAQDN